MASSSSTVKRRAWINSSRQWSTLEEPDGFGPPSASLADDDVFSDASFTGKIESWLLGCGSDVSAENSRQLSFEAALQANNLADDLSLGADASIINGGEITPGACHAQHPSFNKQLSKFSSSTPRQKLCPPSLNLGHSMASSCLSSSTWKTVSSVSEALQMCSEDPEETLYELGFGCEEPQVTVRIPPRFFTFPSQARGINFRLFLDSQIQRIREEDPSLSLASRFRQVQVLTAMANAFYSLFSHVSRTPLQKLETPEFNISSPVERIGRFRTSVRSEPRSPVERLKDTVNKMCLYTGSPRGSDSTSPQPSPRKRASLPDVVDIVIKTKTGTSKQLDLGEQAKSEVDFKLITDCGKMEQTSPDPDVHQKEHNIRHMEMLNRKRTDSVETGENRQTDRGPHSLRTSLASSLSGETVIETEPLLPPLKPDSRWTKSDTRTAKMNLAATVSYDKICPQIIERAHQASFPCQNTHSITSMADSTGRCPKSFKPCTKALICEPDEDSHSCNAATSRKASQADALESLPVKGPSGSYAHYCITVTGWEGDDVNPADSCCTSPVTSTQTPEESLNEEERQYLNPPTHLDLAKLSNNPQQVNSFELEEVHSAGEEDFAQPEATKTAPSPLFRKPSHKGEVVRGDSLQSDSSGYADEEVSPSPERRSR
ncbi:protein TESPA1 [Kryptolebias marmoratus]|uniref:Protein TESPA1-like n=1 Tax=Kryptolebias marmoratus TaxID=37003 RepID=A0A3Q3FUX2_KRYMA|nr:protein TESPA1 [Kryptolebias marmoratus]